MDEHSLDEAPDTSDAEEDAQQEDPEQYLDRLFSGLQTLHAKVNLKLAKLQRRREWIFAEGHLRTDTVQHNVRQAISLFVDINSELADTTALEAEAVVNRFVEIVTQRFGDDRAALLTDTARQFIDEATELWHLTDEAIDSPHYPYLRRVLDMPAYETEQVYFGQLKKRFLAVFVHGVDEDRQ
jgi:hypothetical protein